MKVSKQQRMQIGYQDRYGQEIREGDIVKVVKLGIVFIVKANATWSEVPDGVLHYSEVIGNIYDSPELVNKVATM